MTTSGRGRDRSRGSFVQWLKYGFIVASNVVLIVFLLVEGVSAFEILLLAAGEATAAICIYPLVRAVHRLLGRSRGGPASDQPAILRELLSSLGALLFLGAVMFLFPGLGWLMAEVRPEPPLFFANPAFREAALYIAIALVGRFFMELAEVGRRQLYDADPRHLGPVAQYFVALFAVAAGSVAILVLDLPTTTLVFFLVAKTAGDLIFARYLKENPNPIVRSYGNRR